MSEAATKKGRKVAKKAGRTSRQAAQTRSAVDSSTGDVRDDAALMLSERLIHFYSTHDASKNVAKLIAKYAGKEAKLFAAIAKKYGDDALEKTDATLLAKAGVDSDVKARAKKSKSKRKSKDIRGVAVPPAGGRGVLATGTTAGKKAKRVSKKIAAAKAAQAAAAGAAQAAKAAKAAKARAKPPAEEEPAESTANPPHNTAQRASKKVSAAKAAAVAEEEAIAAVEAAAAPIDETGASAKKTKRKSQKLKGARAAGEGAGASAMLPTRIPSVEASSAAGATADADAAGVKSSPKGKAQKWTKTAKSVRISFPTEGVTEEKEKEKEKKKKKKKKKGVARAKSARMLALSANLAGIPMGGMLGGTPPPRPHLRRSQSEGGAGDLEATTSHGARTPGSDGETLVHTPTLRAMRTSRKPTSRRKKFAFGSKSSGAIISSTPSCAAADGGGAAPPATPTGGGAAVAKGGVRKKFDFSSAKKKRSASLDTAAATAASTAPAAPVTKDGSGASSDVDSDEI